jgi:hypothetical protein
MTVTIANNMTLIDGGENAANYNSNAPLAVTGFQREGTNAIGDQASNDWENLYVSFTSEDYSDRTVFCWMRSGNPNTEANDGFGIILGSGTDTDVLAYSVGGSDNFAHFVLGWSSFRLDTASLPANTRTISGGAPTITAITDLGASCGMNSKAAGNADNVFSDAFTWIGNGAAALTIAGGTTGARGTFAEMVTEDIDIAVTKAYGIIRELVGAKAYEMFFGCDWGDAGTASTYFEDADFQLYINGGGSGDASMTAGNMDMTMLANSTGTNVFNLADGVIVGVLTVSNWDVSDANIDELMWDRLSFTDLGTMTLPLQDAGQKYLADCIFNNCGQVIPSTLDLDNITFNGATNILGAMFLDEATHANMANITFNSDGAGHAIELTPVGAGPFTFTWTGFVFNGYGVDGTTDASLIIDNANDADITINTDFATTFTKSAGYTGNVTIVVAPVATKVTVQNETPAFLENARVFLETADDGTTGFPYQDAVTTLTQTGNVATLTSTGVHGMVTGDKVVVRGAVPEDYNATATITVTTTSIFTYPINDNPTSPATGTPIYSYVPLQGLTDVNGEITASRTWPAAQSLQGWARLTNATAPFYKQAKISVADAQGGTDIVVTLLDDE